MNDFRDLKVWKVARQFSIDVYKATSNLPASETFGLQSQMRRAAVSIPVNLAEGAGRNSPKEFRQFVGIAIGSAYELETLISISDEVYTGADKVVIKDCGEKLDHINRMLYQLRRSLS